MKKNLRFQCALGLLAYLLIANTVHAQNGLLIFQGRILTASCNAQALSTAMAGRQSSLNGQDCGLAVGSSNASAFSVATVREEIVSTGTDVTSVKKLVVLTYN